MKLLVVASDKGGHFVPFIEEQITALEALGVQIIRYGITGKGIIGYLRCLPALRRLIRMERPDIVHAHYGLSGLLANLQRMVPVITTYHGSDINKPSIRRFSKIAMRLSAHNIFVSQRNVALALGEVQAQCTVYSVQCKGAENSEAETTASTPYTLHPTPNEADWKSLLDMLRLLGLHSYWLSDEYHALAQKELDKVDMSQQYDFLVKLYRTPRWKQRIKQRIVRTAVPLKHKLKQIRSKKIDNVNVVIDNKQYRESLFGHK